MNRIATCILCLSLAACAGTPQIETKDVNIAVPVKCAPKVKPPDGHLAHTKEELWAMLSKTTNVTEQARIVSDQLLLWLGYGSQLEAAIKSCSGEK